jgi:hypothetical protein
MNEGPLSPDRTEPGWGITAAELILRMKKKRASKTLDKRQKKTKNTI